MNCARTLSAEIKMSAYKARLLSAFSNASKLPPDQKYDDGSICKEVSMQDCGPFLDPFEYLNQHAWRKMAEYGSQEVSRLTKALRTEES